MSDIFVSCAHARANEAEKVSAAFKALGYGVWRDNELPPHRAYADVIAERLQAVRAVVVIWSAEAVQSVWVRSEASKGRADNKLVQIRIDGAALPMPFDQIRCIDLPDWAGDQEHPAWKSVVASVAELVSGHGVLPVAALAAPPAPRLSICVFPFDNMSADPEQEYFSDGISEDIITDLSKVSALSVVARNTSFTFKGKAADVRRAGRELNVAYVLEGSVRKAANRVRITAQLIDVASGAHLWAERWDRDLTDIFAIQDEISQAVVAALKLRLLPEEKKAIETRGTASPEAYDLYLMARQHRASGNEGDPRREEAIIDLADRATRIDPNYAHAWALMALSQSVLHFNYRRGGDNGLTAAERALSLDPDLAEAHAVRARHLSNQGKRDEAFAELEIALRLDPDSWEANKDVGLLYMHQRNFGEAVRHYQKTTDLSETDFSSPMLLVTCHAALGDNASARRAAEVARTRAAKAVAEDRSNGSAMATGCFALAFLGNAVEARDWARRALLIDPHNMVMRYNIACALSAYLKDADGAVEVLQELLGAADRMWLDHMKADPDLDPIRDHPRFAAMIATVEARLAKGTRTGKAAK
ncbi:MAG TPA: TIR domain-containing protein [Caulobacteraceae bacterium]